MQRTNNVPTTTWVLLSFTLWYVIAVIVGIAGVALAWPLRSLFAGGGDWVRSLPLWASYLAACFAAYWLIRLLRTRAGAPRSVWLGVMGLEIGALVVGVFQLLIASKALDLTGFVTGDLPSALLPALGAWLAGRRPDVLAATTSPVPETPEGS